MKEDFSEALKGKKIPILTLDSKWYKLLDEQTRAELADKEEELNGLLRRQGKLNTETKDIRLLKKKLMGEIVTMAEEAEQKKDPALDKKLEQHKKLLEECNEKIENYEDELLEVPRRIEELNFELMLATMECCYDTMQENTDKINEISDWVAEVRVELKKQLVRKQQMEQKNHLIYSYMHDVFGAEVVNMFDMQYNPEEQHPVLGEEENK